ncbi:nephrin-like, partial [Stegodyphus dumicola]|uniref:nephrin-like n=1 Tax=Stegodyphus dumicola TaxID=202533 RepID=UPI0015AE5E3F
MSKQIYQLDIEGRSHVILGFPIPVVTWRKGSRILPGSITIDEHGVVKNELRFNHLRKEDLLTVLTCQASNNNVTGPIHTSVTLDLNLEPQSVQITTVPTVLKAGQRIEVNCQSEGSRPPARISWTKGSERVDHLAIQNTFGSISVSTISFVAAWEDNGKKLTCEAQNPELPESALQDSWTLNVLYPPQLSLVFGASEQYEHIREGSDVYFECNIQANPPVTEVKWRFQGRNLIHDSLRGIIIRNHSLLLHNVGRRNRGTYQCLATNAQGRGRSEEVVLRIQYSVEADPHDVIFRWTFNNILSETVNIFSFDAIGKTKSIAKYVPETKIDYGSLYYYAKNSIGNMARTIYLQHNASTVIYNFQILVNREIMRIIRLTFLFSGPPEPLQNCTITNQSFSALTLSCDPGDDGGEKQSFHLELYSMKREQLLANITSNENPNFLVRGLPTGSSFIVVIYASNSRGRSTSVALTASTLFSAERQTDDDSRSVISAVLLVSLAALGTLALLAVAAVVAVVRNKRNSSNEVVTTAQEMVEKTPKVSKPTYDDGNPYVYHTREVTT